MFSTTLSQPALSGTPREQAAPRTRLGFARIVAHVLDAWRTAHVATAAYEHLKHRAHRPAAARTVHDTFYSHIDRIH